MIILGERYKFTELELREMSKKFKTVRTIECKNKEPLRLTKELIAAVEDTKGKLIVLNVPPFAKDEPIKTLTDVSFQLAPRGVRFMTLEHFMFNI